MRKLFENWRRGKEKILKEKMVLEKYEKYSERVALAYKARPVKDERVVPSYESLIESNDRWFEILQSKIDVEFTSDYDPHGEIGYASTEEMIDSVKETGILYVDTKHADHPVFSKKQNLKFRAVHDYIVHIEGGKKSSGKTFDLKGEIQAYNLHAKLAPKKAYPALFSEVVGQVCFKTVTGNFPDPQKACYLFGFDFIEVGKIDEEAYKKNFMEKYGGEEVNDL